MSAFKINYMLVFRICGIIGLLSFAFFFPDITVYLFLAFICMLIGKPIAAAISNIHVFKKPIPRSISAVFTLLIFLLVLLLSVLFFVPSLIKELKVLQNFDHERLISNLTLYLNDIQLYLHDKNFLEADQTLVSIIVDGLIEWVDIGTIPHMLAGVVNSTGMFFFGVFAVFFIAFFFIKDDMHVENVLKVFFNKKYVNRLTQVVENINHLLSRYFIGIVIKTAIMTLLLYIGFALFGIKGALLMALIGGITNIIPYLGPFIGWGVVCLFVLSNCLGTGSYGDILPMLIKVSVTFISSNAVDNLVLGPLIYSQSIKAHPVEVFIVTILGGRIAGITGMVLAIPVYTILRIALIEIYHYVTEKEAELYDENMNVEKKE